MSGGAGGPPRPGGRRRRDPLSAEDLELWRRVAETVRPAGRERGGRAALAASSAKAPPADAAPGPPSPPLPPSPPPPPAPPEPPAARRTLRPEGRPEPTFRWSEPFDDRPRPVAAPTPGLDRATARRLSRGRLAPEARLDLHGLTSDRAHAALTRFVSESWASGRRCVLVVTGKGRGEGGARGEGVLRREAPRWLGVSPLREMVVGVFEAHPKHGGGGALYVYVKRRRPR